jgi:hypothetical protein
MPDLEAVGDAATGGVIARAVEPRAGEAANGHTHEKNCLNCGAELTGDFCHECGQKAHVHRTIAAWWHDLIHGVLHLDGKFWRTLPLLAWRPGELTRRYVEGERAKFVSPMAIFLFSVFLMFAVFSATGSSLFGDPTRIGAELGQEIETTEAAVAKLERDRAALVQAGRPTADVDRRIASAREDLMALRRLREDGILSAGSANVEDPVEIELPDGPSLGVFDEAYRKAKENPSLLFYKMQTNAYKFSWALIPLSVPFLWLLFLHRRRYREQFSGYDHFVFTTYSIAAMSLVLIAFVLLRAIGLRHGLFNLALVVIPPVHIYRQLRGAYRLSRWSAAWRTAMLLFFAVLVLTLFGLSLLAIGVFG